MRRLTMILALSLILGTTWTQSRPPSAPPSTGPSTGQKICLTETELRALLTQAVDEAVNGALAVRDASWRDVVAQERARADKAERHVARLRQAAPWAAVGAIALIAGAFVGGVAAAR